MPLADHEARLDVYEADLYAHLERPRKVKQKSLPNGHYKTWGHGNSRELINRIGQFEFLRATYTPWIMPKAS